MKILNRIYRYASCFLPSLKKVLAGKPNRRNRDKEREGEREKEREERREIDKDERKGDSTAFPVKRHFSSGINRALNYCSDNKKKLCVQKGISCHPGVPDSGDIHTLSCAFGFSAGTAIPPSIRWVIFIRTSSAGAVDDDDRQAYIILSYASFVCLLFL